MTEDLTDIDGVGPALAEQLRGAGFETVADVHDADVDDLAGVHLLGEKSAKKGVRKMRDVLENDD